MTTDRMRIGPSMCRSCRSQSRLSETVGERSGRSVRLGNLASLVAQSEMIRYSIRICGPLRLSIASSTVMLSSMPEYRIKEAAVLLGVSDDTLRRWIDAGRIQVSSDAAGRQTVAGVDLARLAQEVAQIPGDDASAHAHSARNRFTGLVTRVVRDRVMAQVEIQAGPYRVVSLISREAADELGLEPGVLAVAAVKATNVTIELEQK